MNTRIIIIGIGDLARRIATGLVYGSLVDELILCGGASGGAFASLLAASGDVRVRHIQLDAADVGMIERLLRRERCDLLLHAASLLSPWHEATNAPGPIRDAGFAAQLPMQLPLIAAVMRGVREAGYGGPVINCSYPDLTHPILARLDLAPTAGIGNAGMIQALARTAWREAARSEGIGAPPPLIRVIAHHAHVTGAVLAQPPEAPEDRPGTYIGEGGERDDLLPYRTPGLRSDRTLNTLSAACALRLIGALLPGGAPARLSVPGPAGLPGGYPVIAGPPGISLDLPAGVSLDDAVGFNTAASRGDGVERIDDDGTLIYNERARHALESLGPGLGEPLRPADAMERFRRLRAALNA